MPTFQYKAKQGPTKIVEGRLDADNLDAAIQKVIGLKLSPLDVSPASVAESRPTKSSGAASKFSFSFAKKISFNDIVLLTRQLSDLIEASIPVLKCLQIVAAQTPHPGLKEILNKMYQSVKDGSSFSDALSHYPKTFPPLYVNMVRTGEVSGQLEIVLKRLAEYYEKEQETLSKIKSSLAYPALIMFVGFATVFVLLTFVIPRLTAMFEDMNQSLPWPTLVLINLSDFMSKFWWLFIAAIIGAVFYFKQWIQSDAGKRQCDRFVLKIPLIGEFLKIAEVGRLARTLATLVESGIPIPFALRAMSATIDNTVLKDEVVRMTEHVTGGGSLKSALKQTSFFPDMAIQMISIGEETGRLERGLYKVADIFEKQSDQTMKTVVSLLGPLVLVVIVGIVGFVVMAMLLPIFKMNMVVQ